MTTITLKLPEALVERADGAARAMNRPLEDILAAMLDGVLPALDDVPADMQAELVEMTWWDDATLMAAADEMLSEAGISLRESGGVYFVPESHSTQLDALCRLRHGAP